MVRRWIAALTLRVWSWAETRDVRDFYTPGTKNIRPVSKDFLVAAWFRLYQANMKMKRQLDGEDV